MISEFVYKLSYILDEISYVLNKISNIRIKISYLIQHEISYLPYILFAILDI